VGPRTGSQALEAFVWGGDRQALWSTLYALDPTGERMQSQYWGVPSARAVGAPRASADAAVAARAAAPSTPEAPSSPVMPRWRQALAAAGTVLPWWLVLLALPGLAWMRPRAGAALWLAPPLATVAVPALFAYVEPRAFLLLVPTAALLAAATLARLADLVPRRVQAVLAVAGTVLLLAGPLVDLARAWGQETPLQRAASARRAVGVYLGEHLAPAARIVSWHPAVALWAERDWRVMPYADLPDIVRYARAQGAGVLVFSTFEPSPLRDPPRTFTVVLLDGATVPVGQLRLEPVEETPLVFVGRLAPGRAP